MMKYQPKPLILLPIGLGLIVWGAKVAVNYKPVVPPSVAPKAITEPAMDPDALRWYVSRAGQTVMVATTTMTVVPIIINNARSYTFKEDK